MRMSGDRHGRRSLEPTTCAILVHEDLVPSRTHVDDSNERRPTRSPSQRCSGLVGRSGITLALIALAREFSGCPDFCLVSRYIHPAFREKYALSTVSRSVSVGETTNSFVGVHAYRGSQTRASSKPW
jgi:hypothetical protein